MPPPTDVALAPEHDDTLEQHDDTLEQYDDGAYRRTQTPHGQSPAPRQPVPAVDARLADYRMPAEWDEHEATLVSWPTRRELWHGQFADAKAEYAGVVRAVADVEPVLVLCRPGAAGEVRDLCGTANVQTLELPLDDSWIRDNGPLVVVDGTGRRLGVDFTFNSWGGKFLPYDADADASRVVLAELGIERVPVDMVLEGGSLTVDGEGTAVVTAQCLLHSNRNPHLSQSDIELVLRAALGLEQVTWLPFGHLDDRHTDGHVDGVFTYTAPGRAIAQTSGDPHNVNHEAMARNLRHLRDHPDARGRQVEVSGLSLFPVFELGGVQEYVSYANFYVANGVVVVPTSGHSDMDSAALASIGQAFPGRQTVGVAGNVIAFGGGGPHCITMQIPRGGR